ncbi:E3 SUMO-protein ligase ZBED1-like isoform X3 [Eleginops maclovinus]|uniref:E3 SUMO-protein ligase ZBED1-like isoform X3 n=1 Tax=Eleginops maclovinus TaxID=56733 RepID=UPI00308053BB
MAPLRLKRSKVWLHFTLHKDGNRAFCNHCKLLITSAGGNTSNMHKHLRTQHGINFNECRVFDALRSDSSQASTTTVTLGANTEGNSGELPKHMLLLDVRTRWNSLYLMMERFTEQFPAIQAAAIDPRIRRPMEKERLDRIGNEDLRKAEEFVHLMRKHYTSTLTVSSDKSATCGEILPILQKLEQQYTVQEGDSAFTRSIKENIWKDLSKRYQGTDIQRFLEEATILDPRFKYKVKSDAVWDRIREAAITANTVAARDELPGEGETQREGCEDGEEEEVEEHYALPPPSKKTALEELFEEEDNELQSIRESQPRLSLAQKVDQEIQFYKSLPSIPCRDSAALWWWNKQDTLPLLSGLAENYLCVQASSTPSERVFSTAGDTISPERSRILPEKADMLIFLQKNC